MRTLNALLQSSNAISPAEFSTNQRHTHIGAFQFRTVALPAMVGIKRYVHVELRIADEVPGDTDTTERENTNHNQEDFPPGHDVILE